MSNINFHELEAEKYWSFPKSYKGNPKTETKNMIFSNDYYGSIKVDGAYYRFIKDEDGTICLQGRSRSVNGHFLDKVALVPHLHEFFNNLPSGTCLLGEVYFPNNEGSNKVTTIMGCGVEKAIARQNTGTKLHYYIFDIWSWAGESYLDKKIEDRIEKLKWISSEYTSEFVEYAEYFRGEELWSTLQNTLAAGREGMVITKKGTVPAPGKRTARKTLKIKKELSDTIDCFFTGRCSPPTRVYNGKEIETWQFWENEITGEKLMGNYYFEMDNGTPLTPVTKPYYYNWAGSLEIAVVNKEKKIVPIGYISGLADEIKSNYKNYAKKCIEVTAMEVHETGGLRHAKIVKFRPDLNFTDCTWEKYMGNE